MAGCALAAAAAAAAGLSAPQRSATFFFWTCNPGYVGNGTLKAQIANLTAAGLPKGSISFAPAPALSLWPERWPGPMLVRADNESWCESCNCARANLGWSVAELAKLGPVYPLVDDRTMSNCAIDKTAAGQTCGRIWIDLFGSAARRARLVSEMLAMARENGYSGYNLDLELSNKMVDPLENAALTNGYTAFVREVAAALRAEDPSWKLQLDIGGCDWDPEDLNHPDFLGLHPADARKIAGLEAISMETYTDNVTRTHREQKPGPNGTEIWYNSSVNGSYFPCIRDAYSVKVARPGLNPKIDLSPAGAMGLRTQLEAVSANNMTKVALWQFQFVSQWLSELRAWLQNEW